MKVSDSLRQEIRDYKKKNPESSSRSIATLFGIHHKTINRILKEVEVASTQTPTKKRKVKILLLDIETFPNVSYTWGKYQQDVIEFLQESCIACYAAKWLGEETFAKSLPDYEGYTPGSYDDSGLVADLWALLDEADVIIAHNGDSFDIKIIQGRFLVHKLPPPSPFKTIDTKKVVKNVARFNSNRLDDLARIFINEKKISTSFGLWKGCIAGDKASWDKMVGYNIKDVDLLESVYLIVRPYMDKHPNYGAYGDETVCPKCGSKDLQARGLARSMTRVYQRWHCQTCGGWSRSVRCEKDMGAELTNL